MIGTVSVVPFPTVGLSLGNSGFCSSKPLTTNRDLVLPSLVVITHLVDNVFCPQLTTSSYVSNCANFSSSVSLALLISVALVSDTTVIFI